MKFTIHEHGYTVDYDGFETEYDRYVEKEAVQIFHKPTHYCDSETGYYLYQCPLEEAERIVKEINDKRNSAYDDYANLYPATRGIIIVVTTPYND